MVDAPLRSMSPGWPMGALPRCADRPTEMQSEWRRHTPLTTDMPAIRAEPRSPPPPHPCRTRRVLHKVCDSRAAPPCAKRISSGAWCSS